MKVLRRLIPILIAAAIVAVIAFIASSETFGGGEAVTLWYVEGSPLADSVKEYAEKYNSLADRAGLPVELKGFESEDALAESFDVSSPDILMCTHIRAFSLNNRDKLTDISANMQNIPNYAQSVTSRSASMGKSFFPVGFDIPVLAVNNSLCEKGFDSLEAMLTEASAYTVQTGKPFFGCDDFSELFALVMLRNGKEFGADFENEAGKQYIDLYNLLGRSAFEGSMYTKGEGLAGYIAAGVLPCAVVGSSALAGMSHDGMSVYDVPPPVNYVNQDTIGTAYGLAVTNGGGAGASDIGAFISWLFRDGKCITAAQNASLAPAETAESTAVDTLSAITQGAMVSLCDPDSPYAANRENFDAAFRAAAEILLP